MGRWGLWAVLIMLFLGCTPPRQRRFDAWAIPENVVAFERALETCSYLPSTPEDHGYLDPLLSGKRILFLGESHYVPKIQAAEADLAIEARRRLGFGVLAMESLYSGWPFLEALSLDGGTSVTRDGRTAAESLLVTPIRARVLAYNRKVPAGERLMVTAVDIDHAIYHTKPKTIQYFEYLASRSSSEVGRKELLAEIPTLLLVRNLEETLSYLSRLEVLFQAHEPSFLASDMEEIRFSLDLERNSARYQYGWRKEAMEIGAQKNPETEELRGRFFRQSITRALHKAEAAGTSLICVVGGAHAIKSEFGPGDSIVGRIAEARYFEMEFPGTLGRTASIMIMEARRLKNGGRWADCVLARMGRKEQMFINLKDFSRLPEASVLFPLSDLAFLARRYDGLLIVR